MLNNLVKLWGLSGFFRGIVVAFCLVFTGLIVSTSLFSYSTKTIDQKEQDEQQKKQADEQQKKQADEQQKKQADEQQKKQADEQQKKQADEQQKKQADEQQKKQADEQRRQAEEQRKAREAEVQRKLENERGKAELAEIERQRIEKLKNQKPPPLVVNFPSPGTWSVVDPQAKSKEIMRLTLDADNSYSDGNDQNTIGKTYKQTGKFIYFFEKNLSTTDAPVEALVLKVLQSDSPGVWTVERLKPKPSKTLELRFVPDGTP